MKSSRMRYSFAAAAFLGSAAVLSATSCVSSSDSSATGGTASTSEGGSTNTSAGGATSSSSGGSTATAAGGAGGAGGATTAPTSTAGAPAVSTVPVACPTPTSPVITDFAYAATATSTSTVNFGVFDVVPTVFTGGTFIYPNSEAVPVPLYPLTSNVTESNWHITGSVGNYSGFGLYFFNCTKLDASAYRGISFVISGSVATGVATSANTVTLNVGTAGDDITSAWLNSHKALPTDPDKAANFGRCTPLASQYDGSCAGPSKSIVVTAVPTTITVLWTELLGGKPEPGVTPSEIVSIGFSVPAPTNPGLANAVTYPLDVVIDDFVFVP